MPSGRPETSGEFPGGSTGAAIPYDDAPIRPFHFRVAIASTGGTFSDGFGLGIIGFALSVSTQQLELTPFWLGLLGGGSLAGLFVGALMAGPFTDQFGRRPAFAWNMGLLACLSALQFFAASGGQLLALRLAIGFLLGTDYVVSKALLTEFTPRTFRGPILSLLSVAWAAGYSVAYFVGVALAWGGVDSWRWMLLASAIPCLLILPVRLSIPESPMWLAGHGHAERAAEIVRRCVGAGVTPPARVPPTARGEGRWRQLLSPRWRRQTLVACAFFTSLVIPYFAVGTFVSFVISALNARGGYAGGIAYNLSLLIGAVVGLVVVDRISRRSFLVGSLTLAAAAMMLLTLMQGLPPAIVILLFAIFAGVLSAASSLVYVYIPELFSTDLRASGIGVAVAASRIGSAISTFLLPIVVAQFGVRTALALCFTVLAIGALVCQKWAPETRYLRLGLVDQSLSPAPDWTGASVARRRDS